MNEGRQIAKGGMRSLKEMLNDDYAKARFQEVLGEKAPAFLASVLNATRTNKALLDCEPGSVMSAAMVAASLDLPIDGSLGFAAIVPYKKDGASVAQFQIMYKGLVQLALRSGQYKAMNVSPIYQDEFQGYDIITGDVKITPVHGGQRDQDKQDAICGYLAYFRLVNGFEKVCYWPMEKLKAHGKRYSKSFGREYGLWNTDPHAMYAKTVLKNTLSKWGILSTTMQLAVKADQAVIHSYDGKQLEEAAVEYVDGVELAPDEPAQIPAQQDPGRVQAIYQVYMDYINSGHLNKKQEAVLTDAMDRKESDVIILEAILAKAKAAHDKAVAQAEGGN